MKTRSAPVFYVCSMIIASAVLNAGIVAAMPVTSASQRTVVVDHHDLNLTRASDVAVLESRVARAVRSMCRRPAYVSEPVMDQRRCREDGMRRARSMVDQLILEARMQTAGPVT